MRELRRLIRDPASTLLEKALLRAWRDERPSSEALARTLLALGFVSRSIP